MSSLKQPLGDYLGQVCNAMERIDRYTAGMTRDEFLQNELVQDATIRNLEVIGEVSHKIRTHHRDFADQHPEIPLGAAYAMRNVLVHNPERVDHGQLWQTIENDLPGMHARIASARVEVANTAENRSDGPSP